MTSQRAQAFILTPNPVALTNRDQITSLVRKNRLPSMYAQEEYVQAGGLMSYGPSTPESLRRAATYVDKILKGAKPADLPVEQPTKGPRSDDPPVAAGAGG
jgi:putative tryptophan/tyrosine transport system substrate-binding protein